MTPEERREYNRRYYQEHREEPIVKSGTVKKTVTLDIDIDKWEFLKPILEQYIIDTGQQQDDEEMADMEDIRARLKNGTKVVKALQDGRWSSEYTHVGNGLTGQPLYSVVTINDLKKVTELDFLRHPNVGKTAWTELSQYLRTL